MILNLYGIVVGIGILVGAAVAAYVATKFSIFKSQFTSGDEVWEALPWVVGFGVIGARLYHVVHLWEYYRENLILIPQVWMGGLGIFGGIVGGMLGLWLYTRKKRKFLTLLDVLGIGAPLGQAIGRWGNYFNQELYGKATSKWWGIYIEKEQGYFEPLFLYESLWNLGVFLVLVWLAKNRKKPKKPGTIFVLYMLFYSIGRFFLEGVKTEVWTVGLGKMMVPVAQIVSGVIIVIGGGYLWRMRTKQ